MKYNRFNKQVNESVINTTKENEHNVQVEKDGETQSQIESSKKSFNFIKKKNASNIAQNPIRENQSNTNEEIQNVSNNEINSDTKSFKSLKINNNFKNDNISVNLETGNEDELNKTSIMNEIDSNTKNEKQKGTFGFIKKEKKTEMSSKQAYSNKIHDHKENGDEKQRNKKSVESEKLEELKMDVINFFLCFNSAKSIKSKML
jgi:hypothetical protein